MMKNLLLLILLSLFVSCVEKIDPIALEEEIEQFKNQNSPQAQDLIPPEIQSFVTESSSYPYSQNSIKVDAKTNESAICRFDSSNSSFDTLNYSFSRSSDGQSHVAYYPVSAGKNYSLYVLCKDDAGNESLQYKSLTFSVAVAPTVPEAPTKDTVAPIISNFQPSAPITGVSAELSIDVNESSSCKLDSINSNKSYEDMIAMTPSNNGTMHTYIASGFTTGNSYGYYFYCKDIAGNTSTKFTAEVVVPASAKKLEITQIPEFSLKLGQVRANSVGPYRTNTGPVNYKLLSPPSFVSMGPINSLYHFLLNVSPTQSSHIGRHIIKLQATDDNETVVKDYVINVLPKDPTLSLSGDDSFEIKVGESKSNSVTALGYQGNILFDLVGEPSFISASSSGATFNIAATPTSSSDIGNFSFQVKATDDNTTVFKTVSYKVLAEDIPPLKFNKNTISAVVEVGKTFSTTIIAENITGTLNYSLSGHPNFVSASKIGNNLTLTVTPKSNIEAKDYSFSVMATDDDDSAEIKVALKVNAAEGENYKGTKYLNTDITQLTNPANAGYLFIVNNNINLGRKSIKIQDGIGLKSSGGLLSNGELEGNFILSKTSRNQLFGSDLTFKELYKKEYFPEWSDSLSKAIANAETIIFATGKVYTYSNTLIRRSGNVYLEGNNAILKPDPSSLIGQALISHQELGLLSIKNLTIDFKSAQIHACQGIYSAGSVKFDNLTVENISCQIINGTAFGIYVDLRYNRSINGGQIINIENSKIQNIIATTTGIQKTLTLTGLTISSTYQDYIAGASKIIIKNNLISNILYRGDIKPTNSSLFSSKPIGVNIYIDHRANNSQDPITLENNTIKNGTQLLTFISTNKDIMFNGNTLIPIDKEDAANEQINYSYSSYTVALSHTGSDSSIHFTNNTYNPLKVNPKISGLLINSRYSQRELKISGNKFYSYITLNIGTASPVRNFIFEENLLQRLYFVNTSTGASFETCKFRPYSSNDGENNISEYYQFFNNVKASCYRY